MSEDPDYMEMKLWDWIKMQARSPITIRKRDLWFNAVWIAAVTFVIGIAVGATIRFHDDRNRSSIPMLLKAEPMRAYDNGRLIELRGYNESRRVR